jgi:hypothetical protein
MERDRLQRIPPMLSFASVDLAALLNELQTKLFPEPGLTVEWYFIPSRHLACVSRKPGTATIWIYLHPILNSADTPDYVFRHIFLHELLHLKIPPAVHDGRRTDHPPEFWDALQALSPESASVSEWLWTTHWQVLVRDRKNECLRVRRGWRKSGP